MHTLTTEKTPALTTATAWRSAETGVGATIAAGSHLCIGISAALPMPNMYMKKRTPSIGPVRRPSVSASWKIPPGANARSPVKK